jgi:TrmH family RNA methyltransferase
VLATSDRAGTLALAESVARDVVGRLSRDLVRLEPDELRRVFGADPGVRVVGLARRPEPGPASGAGPGAGPANGPLGADRTAPAVLLDTPRNLGNVGAVVRVAAGLAAGAVWSTGSVDPWHRQVVRAAAGLHFAVPVARLSPDQLAAALDTGPLVAFDRAGEDLRGIAIPDHAILAFGSERRGLNPTLRARADALVAIPMRQAVSSYNLATSTAIALYAWSTGAAAR